MTAFSATAPLKVLAHEHDFRGATMPGFSRAMIPALTLDCEQVDTGVRDFNARMDGATGIDVVLEADGEVVVYRMDENRAVEAMSDGPRAADERVRLVAEPAYGTMAEVGIGVPGEWGVEAVGTTLLDEKPGLHSPSGAVTTQPRLRVPRADPSMATASVRRSSATTTTSSEPLAFAHSSDLSPRSARAHRSSSSSIARDAFSCTSPGVNVPAASSMCFAKNGMETASGIGIIRSVVATSFVTWADRVPPDTPP